MHPLKFYWKGLSDTKAKKTNSTFRVEAKKKMRTAAPTHTTSSDRPPSSTLYVSSLSSGIRRSPNSCSSAFRSQTKRDSHIQDLSQHVTAGQWSPRRDYFGPVDAVAVGIHNNNNEEASSPRPSSGSHSRFGTSAFVSKLDDRYSYLPSSQGRPSTPRGQQDQASPVRPGSTLGSSVGRSARRPGSPSSSCFGSTSSPARDSYVPRRSGADGHTPLRSDFDAARAGSPRGGTSAFLSKTTVGDAHIKAMPKLVDTCVAFLE